MNLFSFTANFGSEDAYRLHFKEQRDAQGVACNAVGKRNVAIMAESTVLEDIETGGIQRHCRYFKAKVLDSHNAEEINATVRESIAEKSIVFSDNSTSHVDIADFIELHIMEKSNKETTKETLKWVHITIATQNETYWPLP